jgi:uncharacterized cupin superfamily protein
MTDPAIKVGNFDWPDASWRFLDESERGALHLGQVAIGRGIYRPGWRWSEHVQPISGKKSAEHVAWIVSGRMSVRAKDGQEVEVGPGEAFSVAAGHDAWVVGDEPCVAMDVIVM